MERNAADIAPVPLFINLEITNPASVAGNDQTEAEHDPILSCLNSPEPPGPVFDILTDISGKFEDSEVVRGSYSPRLKSMTYSFDLKLVSSNSFFSSIHRFVIQDETLTSQLN